MLDDGRVEYRGNVEVDLDAAGHAELRAVPLEWRLQWTYTAAELEAVRRSIAAADDPPLHASYGPDKRAIHPQEHVWRLRVGDRIREVTIHGWPGTRVGALERLWRRLFELHQPPGETSLWRVWTDEGPVERLVDGEVGEVPALAGAPRALFHTEAIAPEGEGEPGSHPPPPDVPLVEVVFRSDGEEIDRLQVFDDGRQVELRDGAAEDPGRLSAARMRAIRSALRGVEWRVLPQRIAV